MTLTWEYRKTNNPQAVEVKSEKEAKGIIGFVKRNASDLEPRMFETKE